MSLLSASAVLSLVVLAMLLVIGGCLFFYPEGRRYRVHASEQATQDLAIRQTPLVEPTFRLAGTGLVLAYPAEPGESGRLLFDNGGPAALYESLGPMRLEYWNGARLPPDGPVAVFLPQPTANPGPALASTLTSDYPVLVFREEDGTILAVRRCRDGTDLTPALIQAARQAERDRED